MHTPGWKPCDWIALCGQRLRASDARLEAADAADLASVLWEREGWRGDGPELVADRHLQSEAAVAAMRCQTTSLGMPRRR